MTQRKRPATRDSVEQTAKKAPARRKAPAKKQAAKTPAKKPRGRPPAPIDLEELAKLAAMQCTLKEVAGWFDVSKTTIINRMKDPAMREVWDNGKQKGFVSLRRAMWRNALDGNVNMQKWLSIQHLGMKDQQQLIAEVDHTVRERHETGLSSLVKNLKSTPAAQNDDEETRQGGEGTG